MAGTTSVDPFWGHVHGGGTFGTWKRRYISVDDSTLKFYRRIGKESVFSIALELVGSISRASNAAPTLQLYRNHAASMAGPVVLQIRMKSEKQLSDWTCFICTACPLMGGIGKPLHVVRNVHVEFDYGKLTYVGLPYEWTQLQSLSPIFDTNHLRLDQIKDRKTAARLGQLRRLNKPLPPCPPSSSSDTSTAAIISNWHDVEKNTDNTDRGNSIKDIAVIVTVSSASLRQSDVSQQDGRLGSVSRRSGLDSALTNTISSNNHLKISYKTIKKIGQGASGSVHLAMIRSGSTGNAAELYLAGIFLVAIKQVKVANPQQNVFLAEEISIMSSCRHKNIVGFIEAFAADDERLCLVMEYMGGGTLAQVIEQNGSLSNSQIAAICHEVI